MLIIPGWAPHCSRPNAGTRTVRAHVPPRTCSAVLADATAAHLPGWTGKLTPHVLRHYCASQLYGAGMTLFAIQELLGHSWTGTTARYVHVHRSHVEDAWVQAHERATDRWKGLSR